MFQESRRLRFWAYHVTGNYRGRALHLPSQLGTTQLRKRKKTYVHATCRREEKTTGRREKKKNSGLDGKFSFGRNVGVHHNVLPDCGYIGVRKLVEEREIGVAINARFGDGIGSGFDYGLGSSFGDGIRGVGD